MFAGAAAMILCHVGRKLGDQGTIGLCGERNLLGSMLDGQFGGKFA